MSAEVVRRYWELMRSNDFHAVGDVLADGFVLEWPQTNERFRGRERFAAVNDEYPAEGRWTFEVQRLVEDGATVVTDAVVRNIDVEVRVVSFFSVLDGAITRLVEYWIEDGEPPHDRSRLSERIRS